jgi:TolA-binding protein
MADRVWAEEAWHALRRHWGEDPRQSLHLIARLYDAAGDSVLGDNFLYERAHILWRQGELGAARDGFEVMIERHPFSGLRHEARWKIARLEMAQGDSERALYYLRVLAEDRDDSWQVGIYESDLADDARFWRGLLMARALDRPEGALGEFSVFLRDFPTSRLRDDARWNLAVLEARRGRGAQAREHCRDLQEEDPESRWVQPCQGPLEGLDLSDAGLEDFDWEEAGP